MNYQLAKARRGRLGPRAFVLFALVWALPAIGDGATVTNILGNVYLQFFNLCINVGDVVVWVNQGSATNTTASYGGAWSSPPLAPGDAFAFTFTQSGFYAYRTGDPSTPYTVWGAITVNGWTNAPPVVTINSPADNSVAYPFQSGSPFQSSNPGTLLASVNDPSDIVQVEFLANGSLIGTATNLPFAVEWTNAPQGQYLIVARSTDRQGTTNDSIPVHLHTVADVTLWGARLIPGGKLMAFYNGFPSQYYYVRAGPDFIHTATYISPIPTSGAFVDESLPVAGPRFYWLLVHR
jgi:Bacterial Ig domain